MKTKTIFLSLILSFYTLFSQNYSVNFTSQALRYLAQTQYPSIVGASEFHYSTVKIENTETSNDTSFFYYTNDFLSDTCGQAQAYECFNKYSGSILGSKTFILSNGDSYFVFRNDTFLIKTTGEINETWHFINRPNSKYIEAKVINIDTLTTFNGIDSVNYIELNMKNASNNITNDIINGTTIILSKNYGIISIPDLKKINSTIINHLLTGYGYSPLTNRTVYDFEVNDEFHYFIEDHLSNEYIYNETRKVISKNFSSNNDTVYYSFERKRYYAYNPPIQLFLNDTINKTITNLDSLISNSQFNSCNCDHFMSTNNSYTAYNNRFVTKTYCLPVEQYSDSIYIYNIPSKSNKNTMFEETASMKYILGCGELVHYSAYYESSTPYAHPKEELIYYSKGQEEWGAPIITEAEVLHNYDNVIISPNPFLNVFNISNNSKINEVKIYNTIGELIFYKTNVNSKEISINLENKNSGIYIVSVISKNANSFKIIKK